MLIHTEHIENKSVRLLCRQKHTNIMHFEATHNNDNNLSNFISLSPSLFLLRPMLLLSLQYIPIPPRLSRWQSRSLFRQQNQHNHAIVPGRRNETIICSRISSLRDYIQIIPSHFKHVANNFHPVNFSLFFFLVFLHHSSFHFFSRLGNISSRPTRWGMPSY